MSSQLENLDQAANDSIVGTLRQVLMALLEAYEVEFEQAIITGIQVVLPDDGKGIEPEDRSQCLYYDANGRPYWSKC